MFKTNLKIEKGRIDVAPLVDVVFQLILFFMLSSSFMLQPGIKVELPTVNLPDTERFSRLSVTIRSDGRIFLKDKEVHLQNIQQALKKEKELFPADVLIIKADQKTMHGLVVEVMGIAKQVGMTRIAIATKPNIPKKE